MTEIIKKSLSVYFNTKDLIEFANGNFKEIEKISGFNEEVLIGLFLLRWFKDGKRKDSNFSIGFKYKVEHERELEDLVKYDKLSPALFSQKFADQNTLSDIVIKSLTEQTKLDIHFQIKAFPRENHPETITNELIKLLEKKRYIDVDDEVLLIYSHFTQGLNPDTLSKYLETYPYKLVVQVFWSNGNTLNFLKLKPPTYQHYSLDYHDVFKTSEEA